MRENFHMNEIAANAHILECQQVLDHFGVDPSAGLNEEQVAYQRLKYGENVLAGDSETSVWKVLAANVFNSMNLIIGSALVVSVIIMDWVKFVVLLLVIIINSSIGFWQEFNSEKLWMHFGTCLHQLRIFYARENGLLSPHSKWSQEISF
jgi:P-type Na+/K+ transporter